MAAFGFFRKRQKLVFWIMVGLMLIFLLSGTGQFLRQIFSPDQRGEEVGYVGEDEVTAGELADAQRDLAVLADVLRLPEAVWVRQTQDPALTWSLLVREAERMGLDVSPEVAEAVMLPSDPAQLAQLRAALAVMAGGEVAQDDLRRAAVHGLMVQNAFSAASGGLTISEPELRRTYRDLERKINLAIVPFRAEDYVAQLPPLSPEELEAQVQALFEQAAENQPGQVTEDNPFGFGYFRPPVVRLAYAVVDYGTVLAGIQVSAEDVVAEFRRNPRLYTVPVPVASTQPATDPATAPATQYIRVPATEIGQVQDQVVASLRAQGAARRVREIADRTVQDARRARTDASQGSALEQVVERMREQGLPVALYRAGEYMTYEQVTQNPTLSSARLATEGMSLTLPQVAFSAPTLQPPGARATAFIQVGEVYSRPMELADGDMVVWQLLDARPAQAPEELTEAIRQEVVRDVNLRRAYEMALQSARQVLDRAQQAGLAAAAEQAGKVVTRTGLLPRQVMINTPMLPMPILMPPRVPMVEMGAPAQRFLEQAFDLVPADGEEFLLIDATPATVAATDPATEPATQVATQPADPTSRPAEAGALGLIEVPGERAVFVAQRIEFVPAYEDEYRQRRDGLMAALAALERFRQIGDWISTEAVVARMGFRPARQADAQDR